jgi:pimeloyl-ACP methyl ester carboxylesterase
MKYRPKQSRIRGFSVNFRSLVFRGLRDIDLVEPLSPYRVITPNANAPTRLLLLHGAGLGGWIWERVIPELNFPAEAVDLPGRSGKGVPRDVTLQQCIDFVAGRARGYRAVVVGHSFSAQIALGLASAYPQHVGAVILVGGIASDNGKAFVSLLPLPQRLFMRMVLGRSRDGVKLPPKLIKKQYCSDLDAATTDFVMSRMTPEAPRLYLDKLTWSGMPPDMPRLYVKLMKDKSLSSDEQDEMMQRIAPTRMETLQSGHLPMLSQPRELAAILNRGAAQPMM